MSANNRESSNHGKRGGRLGKLWVATFMVVALGALTACQDLLIPNLNDPDAERALSDPGDLEALIAGTFSLFYDVLLDDSRTGNLMSSYGSEMTAVSTTGAAFNQGAVPRLALDNSGSLPAAAGPWGPRLVWAAMSQISSNINDGLQALELSADPILDSSGNDVTERAKAFAKFMQGIAWGYMSMLFDVGIVVSETEELAADAIQQAIDSQIPSAELREMALTSLGEAISIAGLNSFTLPTSAQRKDFFATPTAWSSTDFIGLANTVAARILVLHARTPQERAAVDWSRVLSFTSSGLTRDFEVTLESSARNSLFYFRAQNNAPTCANCYRMDYQTIGLADVSGAFQTWVNGAVTSRVRFDIVTPDRRITGVTPLDDGAYTKYRVDNNAFPSSRSPYHRSAYQWFRHEHAGFLSDEGTAVMFSVDENNLLRAEAQIYLGSLDAAATLINVTRMRSHTLPDDVLYAGLPPVTAAGVPDGPNCVPRNEAGACGSLLDAVRYERMLELAAYGALRGYFDSRGFGTLLDNSWTEAPIPGDQLELLELVEYTFGGGGSSSAVYSPATMP